jgi:predicted nuclease of predicted toxin-antitoxin system
MRFLVDANMPRSTLAMLTRLDHTSEHVRDIGLGNATDVKIAAYVRSVGAAIVTRDVDFADIRNYPPRDFKGIIVLRMPDDAVAATIVNLLEVFLSRAEFLAGIAGRLAIVEPGRVRFRPPLHE